MDFLHHWPHDSIDHAAAVVLLSHSAGGPDSAVLRGVKYGVGVRVRGDVGVYHRSVDGGGVFIDYCAGAVTFGAINGTLSRRVFPPGRQRRCYSAIIPGPLLTGVGVDCGRRPRDSEPRGGTDSACAETCNRVEFLDPHDLGERSD